MNHISKCIYLKTLDISCCENITDEGIRDLSCGCHLITTLNLSGLNISNQSLVYIANNCPNLQDIDLCSCPFITDFGVSYLANKCKLLQHVDLASTEISDETLKAFGEHCDQITNLNLFNCCVTDTGISSVSKKCSKIKMLDLSNTCVTDMGLLDVATSCFELQELQMQQQNAVLTDVSMSKLLKLCRNLTSIVITADISDDSLSILCKDCNQLSTLNISGAYRISNQGVCHLSHTSPKLKCLVLPDSHAVTDSGLLCLSQYCNHLETLHLGSKLLTDKGLSYLAHGCISLRVLHISGCDGVSDRGLRRLAESCHELRDVYLSDCFYVTDIGVLLLTKGCRRLNHLDLQGCNISDKTLAHIASSSKFITSIALSKFKFSQQVVLAFKAIKQDCHVKLT